MVNLLRALAWWVALRHPRALPCPCSITSGSLHPNRSFAHERQSRLCLSTNFILSSHLTSSHPESSQPSPSCCSRVPRSGQQCLPRGSWEELGRAMAFSWPGVPMAGDRPQRGWAGREGDTEPGNSRLVGWASAEPSWKFDSLGRRFLFSF